MFNVSPYFSYPIPWLFLKIYITVVNFGNKHTCKRATRKCNIIDKSDLTTLQTQSVFIFKLYIVFTCISIMWQTQQSAKEEPFAIKRMLHKKRMSSFCQGKKMHTISNCKKLKYFRIEFKFGPVYKNRTDNV